MKVEIHTTPSVFETLKPEWNELLTQTRSNHVFLTWEWQTTWWAAYEPGELYVLAVRDEGDVLVGLAPWFIRDKTIYSVGCVDVTDYLEVLAHQDCEAAVFTTLADFLSSNPAAYERLDLCNIPEQSPVLAHFPETLRTAGFQVSVENQDVCPIVQLPDDWETYVAQLKKKDRHELRRKMRRAGAQTVEWYVVDETHDLEAELEIFLDLMRSAGPEKAEFLADEQNVRFFRAITSITAQAGWLQLAFLKVEGKYAAAYFNFVYDNQVLVYNSGMDIEAAAGLSAGIVLLGYLIRQAIEQGHTHFDFLRGDEDYKYRMGGIDTQVLKLTASHD